MSRYGDFPLLTKSEAVAAGRAFLVGAAEYERTHLERPPIQRGDTVTFDGGAKRAVADVIPSDGGPSRDHRAGAGGEMSTRITIEPPAEGEHHYTIKVDGRAFLAAVPGQTGACWNIGEYINGERDEATLHVCDLDAMADALCALRRSDAHVDQVRRWEGVDAAARLRETRP